MSPVNITNISRSKEITTGQHIHGFESSHGVENSWAKGSKCLLPICPNAPKFPSTLSISSIYSDMNVHNGARNI
jgi:hypothetical protein